MSQFQYSLYSGFILNPFSVIPMRIKKRSKPGLQSDSRPQGATRVSAMQSDPFVSIWAFLLSSRA